VKFLLQDRLGDHLGFIVGNQGRREMSAHRIFDDLIIVGAAEQDANAGVFMRALAIPIERFQIERQFALVMRSFA
jgi:hypothetical protein